MKNFFLISALFFSGLAFASSAGDCLVQQVFGDVKIESDGNWVKVEKSQVVSEDSVLSVGAGSRVVLSCDGKNYVIRAMSRGTVRNLVSAVSNKSPVKVAGQVGQVKKGVATASTRADDISEDDGWEE